MSKKLSLIIFILVIIAVVVEGYMLLQSYRNPAQKFTGPMEKITVGVEKSLLPALVWIAEDKGYFAENGVEVTIKEFDSGRAAPKAMLDEGGLASPKPGEGGLDMVTVAQTPVMFNSFSAQGGSASGGNPDFAIVSAIVSSYNEITVLARRDRGITKAGDLRGKKVGMTKGSSGQYFLDLFLSNNNLQLSEVEKVDLPTSQLVSNLTTGSVDAISTWNPHLYNAQKVLGGESIIFPTRKILRVDFYFVPNKNFLQNHPEAIAKFLQALKQAEDFIKNNEDKSVDIVAKRLGLDRAFVASVWGDFQFGLFLDSTIIQTLENEAAWAIQNKLTDKTEVPDYHAFISVDALTKVAPEKVQRKQ